MIPSLSPYPSMKDSGVEGLGEIPVGWETHRLRNLVDMRVSNVDKKSHEGEKPVRLCNYSDVYNNDRIGSRLDFMVATASEEEIRRFRLLPKDVLITKDSESWDDIAVPALVEYSASDLVCGYHLALLRPRPELLDGAYLLLLLQSEPVAYQFHVAANGVTRFGLTQNSINSVRLPVPSVAEQSLIARFLDHADRRIRRYIRAKKKQIRLLEEQKQALIHRAVTRGLDPDVPLKPSGAEWLGEIPEHWEVVRIKHLAEVGNGSTPLRGRSDYWENGSFPWLNSSVVNKSRVDEAKQFVTETALRECHLPKLEPGDIIVAITGQGKTRGMSAILALKATINQHLAYIRLRDRKRVEPAYLQASLAVAYAHLRAMSSASGSTKAALTCFDIRNFEVPLAPREEQGEIFSWTQETHQIFDQAHGGLIREIELLQEYRTRLIADVVTGKLDVREAAKNLPEEPEEDEKESEDLEEAGEELEGTEEEE